MEELVEEEDPKEDLTEGGVELTKKDNLMVELVEEGSEPETTVFPWRQGRCGRLC